MKKILILLILLMLFLLIVACPSKIDTTPPVLSTFTVPSSYSDVALPITTLNATDNVGVTGYIITTTEDIPSPSIAGWSKTKPTYYGFVKTGAQTIYAWAKDSEGNVSDYISAEVTYTPTIRNWTIMVWLDADNNLEPMGIDDINEMEYGLEIAKQGDASIESKLAVIVQIDRISEYDTDSYDSGSDWEDTRRYIVKPDSSSSSTSDITSIKLQEMGEVNMGDVNKLKSFIQYCKTNVPADHYALVLWNHGGGVQGSDLFGQNNELTFKAICSDDTSGDILYVAELTDILTDAEDVDIIGLDACLMGMLEVGYEYRPASGKFGADYMVGSVYVEQGDGWAYDKIITRLKGSGTDSEGDPCYSVDTLTALELANLITKEYGDSLETSPYYTDQTQVTLDLSQITNVKDKINLLAKELEDEKSNSLTARNNSYYFGYGTETPHYDLYEFAEYIESSAAFDPTAQAAATNLKSDVDTMITESWGGGPSSYYTGFVEGENGLGFFYPSESSWGSLWWYTTRDTAADFGSSYLYGKLDFCEFDGDDTVETWKEVLEYWYDQGNTVNSDDY